MKSLKEERIGVEFTTTEEYQVIVIDYVNAHKIQVMFLDDYKYKMWTNWNNLERGELKNPFHKSVCGIGFLGINAKGEVPKTKEKGKMIREYTLWHNMIQRCYDEKTRHKNPTYENVTVCKEWHSFSQFLQDIVNIKGYDEWIQNEDYELNKDTYYRDLGIITDCKEYSLETCQFISKKENVSEMLGRCGNPNPKGYRRVRCIETNVIYESTRQAERETGISHSDIIKVCQGNKKSCGGYTWEYVDDRKGD